MGERVGWLRLRRRIGMFRKGGDPLTWLRLPLLVDELMSQEGTNKIS